MGGNLKIPRCIQLVKTRLCLILVSLALTNGFMPVIVFASDHTPVIAAYVFPRDTVLTADQVDVTKLTRINYAFSNIIGGRMVEGYPGDAQNFTVLNGLRTKNPKLTILVSVGGWLWSTGFSDMALTQASRSTFIQSVDEFVTRYQLDGLDIDWEYPGLVGSGHTLRPEDKQNYTSLMKELRIRFDLMQKRLHRKLFITIASGASTEVLDSTEMSEVQKYVDTINLMAYDYYEPSDDKITGNHAPLFTDPLDPKKVSADESVKEYERAGVPASKSVLGVPFYGHVWGDVPPTANGLFQPGKPVPNAYANYAAISTTMIDNGYTRYWDKASQVPYLYNTAKQIFVSYEDPESLTIKCKYVLDHHLAGVMFWDYGSDPSGTLLTAIDTGLGVSKSKALTNGGR
jgi:chitinase